jgi:hypothetical protein
VIKTHHLIEVEDRAKKNKVLKLSIKNTNINTMNKLTLNKE